MENEGKSGAPLPAPETPGGPVFDPDQYRIVQRKGRTLAFLVSAASTIDAAANMSNQSAAEQIVASAQNAIAQFLDSDDICPPWPYPGPPPWLIDIASDLTFIANTAQAGSLRTAILKVAGQVLDRAQELAGASG
jgi:hypothetical protein